MATTNFARLGLWLLTATGACLAANAQQGSVEAGRTKSITCAACHGSDGNSVNPEWPMLAGQHPAYIARQIQAFKNGARTEVTMKPFADTLSDQDALDVAAYFAAQTPAPKGADPALVNLGQQIYRGGIQGRGVAACIACHGPTGDGNPLAAYPRIGGQHATYLVKALNSYRTGARTSDTEVNRMMRDEVALLTDDEIRAVASYLQGLN